VDNYSQVIRKARETMQLSQEDLCRKIAEKVSVLQKIESGRFVPDDSLVKKLEYALRIQLLQPSSKAPPAEEKFSRPMELTLGDVAVMQKKRGEGEDKGERR
jgi:putative transcription factor